jgi:hypothetical protein
MLRSVRPGVPLALVLSGCGALCGCSFIFDSGGPDLPLIGAPPPLDTLQKLNHTSVADSDIMYGIDGTPWVRLEEYNPNPADNLHHLRLIRLAPPAAEEKIDAQQVLATSSTLFLVDRGANGDDTQTTCGVNRQCDADGGAPDDTPTTVTLHTPGDPAPDAIFTFAPSKRGSLISGGYDDVMVYVVSDEMTTSYDIVRRDGSFRRTVDLPLGVKATDLRKYGGFFFDPSGDLFFDRDMNGQVRAISTVDDTPPIALGTLPDGTLIDGSQGTILSCSKDGLRSTPIVAGAADKVCPEDPTGGDLREVTLRPGLRGPRDCTIVIDARGCGPDYTYNSDTIYYFVGDSMWRVRRDLTNAPTEVASLSGVRLLAIGSREQIVYSRDPASRYIYGVGDGWLGGWKFMERGHVTNFSRDQSKIRWLEHAAQEGGVGDLYSAAINGTPRRLQRNVSDYNELGDGRVLCSSDSAFRGVQNRVVVVDEKAGTAQWVVDQASRYQQIPGTNDLLVDIVTGASTSDLMRVSIPPRPGAN